MPTRPSRPARPLLFALLVAAAATASPSVRAADAPTDGRRPIERQADLPRHSYRVEGSASALLEADAATFDAFAAKVRADLDRTLADYDIRDRSTLRQLLGERLDLQELAGEREAALKTIDELRALQDKPAQKLLAGLAARSRVQAAIEVGRAEGPAYEAAFRRRYLSSLSGLPWADVQDAIRATYGWTRLASRGAIVAMARTELDPAVKRSGTLDAGEARALISSRNDLKMALPLALARTEVLREVIAAHSAPRADIWAAREVTLSASEPLTPVKVAIWDSGIDVALFPRQLFDDPRPTRSGAHGLAFDDVGQPSTVWLYPLTPAQREAYATYRGQVKGILDLQNGVDSPEATATQKAFQTLSADAMEQRLALNKVLGFYMHGTHCAGIAVRGNPAARLVVARFNDQLPDLPFAPTEAWARQLGAAFAQMGDYFRTRQVRVVNLSWGDDAEEFETWLSKTGGGADPAARKERAAALFAIWRDAIEHAIRSAPDTLFVVAAGNSDSDVGFIADVPASLSLPNLISVGAVNQAGEETSFTSHGKAVRVHANGYQVPSVVPGGATLNLSGTSMAAPQVVNLAAKLFAIDPSLTPARAIALIEAGATPSDDGRRHLIDPKRSVALLRERQR